MKRYAFAIVLLAALANGTAKLSSQAWNDCLHNNPDWAPDDAPSRTAAGSRRST